MKCDNHSGTEAVGTCSSCGKAICEECRSEVDGKNYCQDCLEDRATSGSIVETLQGNKEYLWSAVAIISTFLPWVTIEFGLGTRALLGLDMDMGILYLLVAAASVWIIWKWDSPKKRKGLMASGILMAMVATSSLYYMISTLAEREQELGDNPFSELVSTEIGIGLYLAFAVSVMIIYQGYKTGLSFDTPFNPSKRIRYALLGINGLFTLLVVSLIVWLGDTEGAGRTTQLFAYILALIAFGGVTYFAFKSNSRERIVQFSLLGMFAVLLFSVAFVDVMINNLNRIDASSLLVTVVPPLIFIIFNLWAVKPESDSVGEPTVEESPQ